MVQKSGDHQLRLVVYPIIYDGFYNEVSKGKKGPWLFSRFMSGMKNYPLLYGDYFINHEIRIPIKTPTRIQWKVSEGLFRGSHDFARWVWRYVWSILRKTHRIHVIMVYILPTFTINVW